MKSSWGHSVWDLAAGVAFASSGFALVYIDNWPGGQWFPLWDSHGQQWAAMGRASQPSTTQRVWTHQRCPHWINRHGTLSGRFDFEKMYCLFRAGGIDIVTLTMCEYQKFKLHIAHFHIVEAGMWYVKIRLLPWIQNCLHPLSHLCLCLPRSHCPANSKIPVLWHSCSILCIVKTTLVLLPPPT